MAAIDRACRKYCACRGYRFVERGQVLLLRESGGLIDRLRLLIISVGGQGTHDR